MKEENYKLLSRNMNEKLLKVKALDTVKEVYGTMSVGSMSLVQMGGEKDIVANMMSRMSALVEDPVS